MGKILFLLLAVVFFVKMLTSSGVKKLPWFFAGILFFPPTIVLITSPSVSFSRFIVYSLLFMFLFQNKNIKEQFFNFPLAKLLLSLFICLLLIGAFDTRISLFQKIYRPSSYFIENFLIVFLTFFYVRSIEDSKRIYNFIATCFFVFAIYGIVNYLTRISLYNSMIAEIYDAIDYGNRYTIIGDARFRIASFAWHAIYYGFLLAVTMLLLVFMYYEKVMQVYNKGFYLVCMALMGLNLIWTNSRTPLLSFMAGLSIYYAFGMGWWNKFRLAFASAIVILGVLIISPDSVKIIDESINTFTSQGSKVDGSSVEMRDIQMEASLLIFSQNPIFGNGFSYIIEDLGYSSDEKKRVSDGEFYGFESYSYKLLIEQGLIGMLGNLIFFVGLFVFSYRMLGKVNVFGKRVIYMSVAMTITFLLFIFGTGDLGSFTFFMSLLGVNIKTIMLSRYDDERGAVNVQLEN